MEPIPSPNIAAELAPTGTLRTAINLGNTVLTHGTPMLPGGISVVLAERLAAALDVPIELTCWNAARKSFDALAAETVDLGFLAIDPLRAQQIAFTRPYVVIEGIYAVPVDATATESTELDREGVRIGVKAGSAYDLHLQRTLEHAELVQGEDGIDVFLADGLEAGAGIRQPMTAAVAERSDLRLLEPSFMQIRQAMAVPRGRSDAAIRFVDSWLDHQLTSGTVAAELARAGQDPTVAASAVLPHR